MARPSLCGRCNNCERCTRADYMREWWNRWTPEEKRAKTSRRNAQLVREQARRKMARRRANPTPEQKRRMDAYLEVGRARKRGDIEVGPCEAGPCGCSGRIEAHHDNYDKPLEVRWVCRAHHQAIHKKEE